MGQFIWPGFGENSRVLKWIFERTDDAVPAKKTAIGYVPESLDLSGISVPQFDSLLQVDKNAWIEETKELETYFKIFGEKMPKALLDELTQLRERLS
jgi:phosphoenolpyruvate carboxykinase (GTP)